MTTRPIDESDPARARRFQALEEALDEPRLAAATDIAALIAGLDPSELADMLEALQPEARLALWQRIDAGCRGEVLVESHGEVRRGLIEATEPDALVQAVEGLDLDELSDIDDDLPPPVLSRVLERMPAQRRRQFESLRRHPDDCAGGLMDADPVTVAPDASAETAAAALRRHREQHGSLPEHLHAVMVTDGDGRYLGMVELAELLVADRQQVVAELMTRQDEAIAVDLPAAEVVRRFEDRNLLSAGVVDAEGRLVGRITVDDVLDVMRAQAERSQLANTGLDEEADTFAPALTASRQRAVWLGVNLCNALFAAVIISLFEETIDQLVALAVLMPVVASMGGVAGTQSMALVIRAIALDQVHGSARWRLLRREIAVGSLNGLLWALVVAVVAAVWFGNPGLAAVFAAAVVLNLMMGVIAGTSIPMAMARMGIDPALAGGVVLVALTDAVGFAVFLGLGSALLL